MNDENLAAIRGALLRWHDENARELPWRHTSDPYSIWISEIMLQQTRAETVIPYYERFIRDYPDARALAAADEDAVLKHWEGLGYYSRARNLHRAARKIASEGGVFPAAYDEIRALPGVGEYTAGAIASIAYKLHTPAIDGNQARVLSRIFLMEQDVASACGKRAFFDIASALLPEDRPGDFNQALMGLGALICLPKSPKCDGCPVADWCAARSVNRQRELPVKEKRAAQKEVRVAVAAVYSGDKVWVRRRPEGGLLAGLFELPCFEGARRAEEVSACLAECGLRVETLKRGGAHVHVFTHRIWRMTGWSAHVAETAGDGRFVDAEELMALPMATAIEPYRRAAVEYLAGRVSP